MDGVLIALRVAAFLTGFLLVFWTIQSAIRAFVLPRSERVLIQTYTFRAVATLFFLRIRKITTYKERDRIMALFAPVSLLMMPVVYLSFVLAGYTLMFWSVDTPPWREALILSGSSLFTLGFAIKTTTPHIILIFTEATIGLGLVALLISYLPTMYSAFSQRERSVAMLEVRAGSPPSAVKMIQRFNRLQRLDALDEFFAEWEVWFAHVEETHTSLPALIFFRSPLAERSWITAAGAVLDGAAMFSSCVTEPKDSFRAALCIRAGYIALRQIADVFQIEYEENPTLDTPISITYQEFAEAYEELVSTNVSVIRPVEEAWTHFKGWRINYDAVLIQLANLTLAPYAPWVSDRSLAINRQPLLKGFFGRIRQKLVE